MGEPETLGDRIKTWRLKKGLSQKQLAKEARLDIAWISRLENGHRDNISLQTARRLAQALGVSVDYLAGTYTDPDRVAAMQAALSGETCIADGALSGGGTG
jgi:transcriptional regulator with XRE-family HTH domain